VSTILVLEDDQNSRSAFQGALQAGGHTVRMAGTAEEALEVCRQHPEAIELLLADIVLPGTSGIEAAQWIKAAYPAVAILFMSGTPIEFCTEADRRTLAEMPKDSFSFLLKPFPYTVLLRAVEEAINRQRPGTGPAVAFRRFMTRVPSGPAPS
jgi:DNA-binding NtrC family response regulator